MGNFFYIEILPLISPLWLRNKAHFKYIILYLITLLIKGFQTIALIKTKSQSHLIIFTNNTTHMPKIICKQTQQVELRLNPFSSERGRQGTALLLFSVEWVNINSVRKTE